ncbi:plasmid partitioning protein RepA [Roseovarius arcticus]|uniref:plasmid partitioning protein RepA n=1 Tax=Roseovarius arcticus TaxID=2547404 RepID=UPI001110BE53|nr:plasmid partitioning protein RepA [Roseovarius arcticus]
MSLDGQETVFHEIERDAKRLTSALNAHIKRSFSPENVKTLRRFTSGEVADLLGISQTYLRKLHHDGKIPDIENDERNRKMYRAEDVQEIRVALAAQSKTPGKFLPKRQKDEPIQIVAVTTFKGGSCKSTSAVHLASFFALAGYRVLCVDLDPQSSLSGLLGQMPDADLNARRTIYDAIRYDEQQVPMQDVIHKTYFPNLDLAPAGLILSEFETESPRALRESDQMPFYLRLKAAISQVEEQYDIVIIDTPPQLGFITLSAMVAATGLLVTVVPNMIDMASLAQFLTMASSLLDVVRQNGYELNYDFIRYLVARFEPSDGPQAQMAAFLRVQFGSSVMTEPFLKSTAVSDAGMTNQTLFEIDRGQINRRTYDRAFESITRVAKELEESIHHAWGRV